MSPAKVPHVLIVGDEASILEYMCQPAGGGLLRCTGVNGGVEAIAAVRRMPIDVVLLDVSHLSLADGLWLAERLRSEAQDLAVVLVAGLWSIQAAVEAFQIGVNDCLLKPVPSHELAAAVDRAIRWRSAALLSRGDSMREQEREMAWRRVRMAASIAEAGIGSAAALDACLSTLYVRDLETLGHLRRVASLSVLLARELRIAEPILSQIERAALLHDVGKLAIPESILGKATPLTDEERALVRSHVQAAFDVMNGSRFLAPSAEIVLATRERYDGGGYPKGLRDDAIPLGARVIAVAEAFDTLTEGRAAGAPMSVSAANAQLVVEAGVRFDPRVVNAWLLRLDLEDAGDDGRVPCL